MSSFSIVKKTLAASPMVFKTKTKNRANKKNPEAGKSGALGKKLELKSQQGGRVLPPALLPSGGLFTPECTSTPLGPSSPPHSVQNDPFPLPLQGKGLAPPPGESLPKCPLAQDFPRDNLSRDWPPHLPADHLVAENHSPPLQWLLPLPQVIPLKGNKLRLCASSGKPC